MARLKADVRDYTSAREFLGLPAVFDPQDSSLSDRQLDRKLGHNTMVSLQTAGLGIRTRQRTGSARRCPWGSAWNPAAVGITGPRPNGSLWMQGPAASRRGKRSSLTEC
jgi:hypothetical protein